MFASMGLSVSKYAFETLDAWLGSCRRIALIVLLMRMLRCARLTLVLDFCRALRPLPQSLCNLVVMRRPAAPTPGGDHAESLVMPGAMMAANPEQFMTRLLGEYSVCMAHPPDPTSVCTL